MDAMPPVGTRITLDDDVLTEILLRLPSKSVLRARAVSKHWRHIATSPCFLAAYSLRRPPEVVVFYALNQQEGCANPVQAGSGDSKNINNYKALGAINFAAEEKDVVRRPLLHYDPETLRLHALCDGLLLLRRGDERLLIWNPATRQAVVLPSLPMRSPQASVRPIGFYCHHRASDEYRVLCHVEQIYYILSAAAAAAEPQRLEVEVEDIIAFPTCSGVALHGSLHRLIRPAKSSDPDKTLVFDTVSHMFRRMEPPPVPAAGNSCYRAPHLFEMHGLLAASAVRDVPHMDVWVLQDYNRESWAWHLRISIPQAPRMLGQPFAATALGMLDGKNVFVVHYGGLVILYDMGGNRKPRPASMLDMRSSDISAVCHQGIYRESLVPLAPP